MGKAEYAWFKLFNYTLMLCCELFNGVHLQSCQGSTSAVSYLIMFTYSRVKAVLDSTSARVAYGGNMDEKTNYISPTLLADVAPNDAVMKDEVCQNISLYLNSSSKLLIVIEKKMS